MKEKKSIDRVTFIAELFNVFEDLEEEINKLEKEGFENEVISKSDGSTIGILSTKTRPNGKITYNISIFIDVFTEMISADPTSKKLYVQWMLTTLSRYIKNTGDDEAMIRGIRLVEEDLPLAGDYLKVFEENKKKKDFVLVNKKNSILSSVVDLTDINQYKDLSQLYEAVDPFIIKDVSELEKKMGRYVKMGQAEIVVKDRSFTIYLPKTVSASTIFSNYANWCTSRKGNSNFNTYTTNYKRPNGKNSDLIIIINNKVFTEESDEMYQIHFETNQIKDKSNSSNVSITNNVIMKSDAVKEYLRSILVENLIDGNGKKGGNYLKFLISFGFSAELFNTINKNTPTIKFIDGVIEKVPSLSNFSNLTQLILVNTKLNEIDKSIGDSSTLEMISLPNNLLKELPESISKLKNLLYLNVKGNKGIKLPKNISELDSSNGGSLILMTIDKDDLSEDELRELKLALPNTRFN